MNTLLVGTGLLVTLAADPTTAPVGERIGIIYGSDLFHPHNDPDDHFDLATLFALPGLDLRAVLLDLGNRQKDKSGRIPLEQMFRLSGKRAPYATGLSRPLRNPKDTGIDQPAEDQGAVELLIRTLRESPEPITVIMVGSVRDLCAAFNREPELLQAKLGRVYLNMGNAGSSSEYNVDLDINAYIGLLRSGLPIWWCPCMPMRVDDPGSTFWEFRQAEVLDRAPLPLLNFFIYALQTVSPKDVDPQAALDMDLRPWRHLVLKMKRSMWATASLLDAAGMKIYKVGSQYVPARVAPEGGRLVEAFTFVPARVEVDDQGKTRCVLNTPDANMQAFRVLDAKEYSEAMKGCLGWLMQHFPLAGADRR